MEGIGRFAHIHEPEGNAIELWEPATWDSNSCWWARRRATHSKPSAFPFVRQQFLENERVYENAKDQNSLKPRLTAW